MNRGWNSFEKRDLKKWKKYILIEVVGRNMEFMGDCGECSGKKKKDKNYRESVFCLREYICHHEPGNTNVKETSDEVSVGNEEDVIRNWRWDF